MRNMYFREVVSCKEYAADIEKEVVVDEPVRVKMRTRGCEEEVNLVKDQEDWEES